MRNHEKVIEEVVKHSEQILMEMGVNYTESECFYFRRGLNEEIEDVFKKLIDEKTQYYFEMFEGEVVVVVKFEGPRPSKSKRDIIENLFYIISGPDNWLDHYQLLEESPEEGASKEWLLIYERMKSVPRLQSKIKQVEELKD